MNTHIPLENSNKENNKQNWKKKNFWFIVRSWKKPSNQSSNQSLLIPPSRRIAIQTPLRHHRVIREEEKDSLSLQQAILSNPLCLILSRPLEPCMHVALLALCVLAHKGKPWGVLSPTRMHVVANHSSLLAFEGWKEKKGGESRERSTGEADWNASWETKRAPRVLAEGVKGVRTPVAHTFYRFGNIWWDMNKIK